MYVGTCLLANFAIAALSFHIFEQPILNLKKRFEYAREAGEKSGPVRHGHAARFEPGTTATKSLGEEILGLCNGAARVGLQLTNLSSHERGSKNAEVE